MASQLQALPHECLLNVLHSLAMRDWAALGCTSSFFGSLIQVGFHPDRHFECEMRLLGQLTHVHTFEIGF